MADICRLLVITHYIFTCTSRTFIIEWAHSGSISLVITYTICYCLYFKTGHQLLVL